MNKSLQTIAELNTVERIPLFWPLNGHIPEMVQTRLEQAENLLRGSIELSATQSLAKIKFNLKRRTIALKYRLQNHSSKAAPDFFSLSALEAISLRWHNDHPLHRTTKLSHAEFSELRIAASYPDFVNLLFEDSELQEEFLQWVLRDHNPVEPFIQYPFMQEKIVASNLSGRLHRASPSALRILTGENRKYLALLIEGHYVNILEGEEKVTLKGNWTLNVDEIFSIFASKTYGAGNLEIFTPGLINWNAHLLAYWDALKGEHVPIDINQPQWWVQLPLLEVLDKSQMRRRFGFAVDGKHWIAAATATRGTPTLDYDQSHAYLEVCIPLQDGRYAVYDFGKMARVFPKNFFETMLIFANSVHATVAYPDENTYYTHRQHAQHAFALLPSEGERLMQIIRRDILKSQEANFVYQIESENCAKWVQTTLQTVLGIDRVPNMFIMPLLDAEPQSPVASLFGLIKKLPSNLQPIVLTRLHFPLGAWRGTWIVEGGKKVWKALNRHPFWHTGLVYLPAFLHKQRQTGTLAIVSGGIEGVLLRKHQLILKRTLFSHKPPMPGFVPYHAPLSGKGKFFLKQYALPANLTSAHSKAGEANARITPLIRGPTA